jgi:hypothetical protein
MRSLLHHIQPGDPLAAAKDSAHRALLAAKNADPPMTEALDHVYARAVENARFDIDPVATFDLTAKLFDLVIEIAGGNALPKVPLSKPWSRPVRGRA